MSAVKRGELLDRYGFEKRWIRWAQVVRVVDAKSIRGVSYLAWINADQSIYSAARWITERNFNRFYRLHTEETT